MAAVQQREMVEPGVVLRTVQDVEAYVALICFKTGPPRLVGVELEWTVHHADAPARPLALDSLAAALGPHSPPTLVPDSPHRPLPHGSHVTVEPGGQVELSTPPSTALQQLFTGTGADLDHLTRRLTTTGLTLGRSGIDEHRPPTRLLHTSRYDALADAFARQGGDGLTMMCSTAGVQVCLDMGDDERLHARWAALHAVGPVLLAAFANSSRRAGRATAWRSARMAAWFGTDPVRTRAVADDTGTDPVTAWTRYALRAPVLCVRREAGPWHAPPGMSFADWVAGAGPRPPTTGDLGLHLSTLFPPVRPRHGYFEVRYLDAQPPGAWLTPVAVLAALFSDETAVDTVREVCAPVAGRWVPAARYGLADRSIRDAAEAVFDLAGSRLAGTGLAPDLRHAVTRTLSRRLAGVPDGAVSGRSAGIPGGAC